MHGAEPGRKNDIQSWYDSDFAADVEGLIDVDGGDLILFDGAFSNVADYFLTPFEGRPDPNSTEGRWNRIQSHCRVLVENYFGVLKRCWPVVGEKYPFWRESIDIVFRACCILTNIINIHQSPMRA